MFKGITNESFDKYFREDIDVKAHAITDKWTGCSPLKDSYKRLEQMESGGGKNFPQLHAHIMRLKAGPRGIHHHCSEKPVKGYLDEFHFRFNRRGFLDKLLTRIVAAPPLLMTLR